MPLEIQIMVKNHKFILKVVMPAWDGYIVIVLQDLSQCCSQASHEEDHLQAIYGLQIFK